MDERDLVAMASKASDALKPLSPALERAANLAQEPVKPALSEEVIDALKTGNLNDWHFKLLFEYLNDLLDYQSQQLETQDELIAGQSKQLDALIQESEKAEARSKKSDKIAYISVLIAIAAFVVAMATLFSSCSSSASIDEALQIIKSDHVLIHVVDTDDDSS